MPVTPKVEKVDPRNPNRVSRRMDRIFFLNLKHLQYQVVVEYVVR